MNCDSLVFPTSLGYRYVFGASPLKVCFEFSISSWKLEIDSRNIEVDFGACNVSGTRSLKGCSGSRFVYRSAKVELRMESRVRELHLAP